MAIGAKLPSIQIARTVERLQGLLPDIGQRPVLIVGNGPSCRTVDYRQIPQDAYVFRCNWFFLEEEYQFGRKVDAYFWSVNNKGLHAELRKSVVAHDYDYGLFMCPFLVPEDGADVTKTYSDVFQPQFDHWQIMSSVPNIARLLMSRPLPTQGVQMLATALILGARDVHLIGMDMYVSKEARYAYNIPPEIAKNFFEKDLRPGYEDKHSLTTDLRALEVVNATFKDAKITNHSPEGPLRRIYPVPQALENFTTEWPRPKGQAAIESGQVGERYYATKTINGEAKRCAYVTYATEDFAFGVAALANSLAKHSDVPLIVMKRAGIEFPFDLGPNTAILSVDEVNNPNLLNSVSQRFADTYNKLNVFGLKFLDKAVFLDADTIVMQPIDELFELDGFHAAPDYGQEANARHFNSGVFYCEPSGQLLADLLDAAGNVTSFDGGDQGLLNEFFSDWVALDRKYNTLKRIQLDLPSLFDVQDIKILHYVGIKPWHHLGKRRNAEHKDLERIWFSHLPEERKLDLIQVFRSAPLSTGATLETIAAEELDKRERKITIRLKEVYEGKLKSLEAKVLEYKETAEGHSNRVNLFGSVISQIGEGLDNALAANQPSFGARVIIGGSSLLRQIAKMEPEHLAGVDFIGCAGKFEVQPDTALHGARIFTMSDAETIEAHGGTPVAVKFVDKIWEYRSAPDAAEIYASRLFHSSSLTHVLGRSSDEIPEALHMLSWLRYWVRRTGVVSAIYYQDFAWLAEGGSIEADKQARWVKDTLNRLGDDLSHG
ncbi:alpha-2,3-sialyltransferase [Sphingobium sp. Z007]|uniref:alpha-2,3-sialyltransferase n=1 Tax=Sphingobium sp. Z007 TaxID=627495 RepID=UPI000B498CBA|nr:alpha-2,3-sialyltransferase [Sphingobium sp. Z007]